MGDLPPKLQALRQSNTFAALCHFLHTFSDPIKLEQCTISNVEDDLAGTGTTVLPHLIARLLIIMTHDRKITHENFTGYLRRQFNRRVPGVPNPLGAEDEPVEWLDVEMMDKLELVFRLCEWQFAGSGRLRTMMGETDGEEWRLEPVGQDREKNTYWLIGENRLWVQRPNPNPPPPPPKKPKRTARPTSSNGKTASNSARSKSRKAAPTRPRGRNTKGKSSTEKKGKGASTSNGTSRTRTRGTREPSPNPSLLVTNTRTRNGGRQPSSRGSSSRPVRSAAVTANANLKKRPFPAEYFDDAGDELGDVDSVPSPAGAGADVPATRSSKRARTGTTTGTGTPMSSSVPPPTKSTRATRNSRRGDDDEQWQAIPQEWLQSDDADADTNVDDADPLSEVEAGIPRPAARGAKRRIESSPDSSLSDAPSPSAAPAAPAEASGTKSAKNGAKIFDDDESDLTDLDEGENAQDEADEDDAAGVEEAEEEEEEEEEDEDEEEYEEELVDEEAAIRLEFSQPKDWVEWETVCVTLEEWEEFPQQFHGSTNTKERQLYKALMEIAEGVVAAMRAAIREAQKEAAVNVRKRSSRIQAIEAQVESEAAERKRLRAEADAELRSRDKRQEKREQSRAERLAEREERQKQREIEAALEAQRELEAAEAASRPPPPPEPEQPVETTASGRPVRGTGKAAAADGAGAKRKAARAPVRERETDWLLDCELCGERGKNVREGPDVVCCEACGLWQHTICYDDLDKEKGKKLRNWDAEHFFCDDCERVNKRRRKNPNLRPKPAPRVNADGQPAATPGPTPAQRKQPRDKHITPKEVPLTAAYPGGNYPGGWNQPGAYPSPSTGPHPYNTTTPQRAVRPPTGQYPYTYPSPTVPPHPQMRPAQPPPVRPPYAHYPHSQSPATGFPSPHGQYPQHMQTPGAPPYGSPYGNGTPSLPPLPSTSGMSILGAPGGGPPLPPPHPSHLLGAGTYPGPARNGLSNGIPPGGSSATFLPSVNGLPPPTNTSTYPVPTTFRDGNVWSSPANSVNSPHASYPPASPFRSNGTPMANQSPYHGHGQDQYRNALPTMPLNSMTPGSSTGSYGQDPQYSLSGSQGAPSPSQPHQFAAHPSPTRQLSNPGYGIAGSPMSTPQGPFQSPSSMALPTTVVPPAAAPQTTPRYTAEEVRHWQFPPAPGVDVGKLTPMAPGSIRGDLRIDQKSGRIIQTHDRTWNPETGLHDRDQSLPLPQPPVPSPLPPRKQPPQVMVEPHGPNQHFSGSFSAVVPGGGNEVANVNGSGGGRHADKQQVYQPPPTKPRVPVGGAAIDNLAALAEAAQAQAHVTPPPNPV